MRKHKKIFQILSIISNFVRTSGFHVGCRKAMAGIYIHIPFCKSRCIYCGFYSTTEASMRQRYVDALCKEIRMRRGELDGQQISTIYLGGGTPSQLSFAQLSQLFDTLHECYNIYNVGRQMEVTMECNPDDVTDEFADSLSHLPVNRVSMGAQTFSEPLLRFIRRRHNARQVAEAVERLRKVGINNISIDLMYGIPGQTMDIWAQDIASALSLGVEHISAYSLMFEEDTPLYQMLEAGDTEEASEDLSVAMFNLLIDRLESAGYEHYEVSNFARKGYRSRHNSSYWTGVPYMGIGAAAHSYDIESRQWNVSDIRAYIKGIEEGHIPAEREPLDERTRYNDAVTVALRTREGINMASYADNYAAYCNKMADKFVKTGLLEKEGTWLRLTRQGIFVSDMIMRELIYVD